MSIGMGPVFPGGQTKNYFNTPGFGLSMSFDVLYRNLYMGMGLFFAGAGLERDIAFKGYDFTPEDRMTVGGVDLRAGYKVLDTRRLALVPYAAIGGTGLSMTRKGDQDYEQTNSAVTYGGGVFLDIKLPDSSAEYLLTGRASSYSCIRLRYHITSADYRLPETGNTLVHWFTVEFGGISRKTHRVRQ
jgi:hypothetical protein